jgi:hypothetical protein
MVIFLAFALTVCGFYGYVLFELHREEKRSKTHKKQLRKDLYEWELGTPSARAKRIVRTVSSRIAQTKLGPRAAFERPLLSPPVGTVARRNAEALARREAVISLILGVGGLAALFAGIELFNFLVTWPH